MFALLIADFDERVLEVELYFQFLSALDNDEIAVVAGTGPQIVPEGPPPADWGRMLKGTAYLVLYNLVEAFVRRGFQTVFESIKSEGLCGTQLIEELQAQWVMQKNRKVKTFDGSPKVYMDIAREILKEIAEQRVVELQSDRLPVAGNLDAEKIREVCRLHGVSPATPPSARGGDALTTVKVKRNTLSHGDESFAECGQSLTAADLVKEKDEIVVFMRSILQNLEEYTRNRRYKSAN